MSNFKKLYEISKRVALLQDELYYLVVEKRIKPNSLEYTSLVKKIKLVVLEENNLVSKLTIEDINIYLCDLKEIIENNFEVEIDDDLNTIEGLDVYIGKLCNGKPEEVYDIAVISRSFDRLKNRYYFLNKQGIRLKLHDKEGDIIYEISIYDAITSELNIEALRAMEKKILELKPVNEESNSIISDLKVMLEALKISVLSTNFSSEIRGIVADNNLNKIGITGLDTFKNINTNTREMISDLLVYSSKDLIQELAVTTEKISDIIANTPNIEESVLAIDTFPLLRIITFLETIINNSDIEVLKEINECCKEYSNEKNESTLSGIDNFIKAKIKRKEK